MASATEESRHIAMVKPRWCFIRIQHVRQRHGSITGQPAVRTQPAQQVAHFQLDALAMTGQVLRDRIRGEVGARCARQVRSVGAHGNQHLPELVVQLPGQPGAFLFLSGQYTRTERASHRFPATGHVGIFPGPGGYGSCFWKARHTTPQEEATAMSFVLLPTFRSRRPRHAQRVSCSNDRLCSWPPRDAGGPRDTFPYSVKTVPLKAIDDAHAVQLSVLMFHPESLTCSSF